MEHRRQHYIQYHAENKKRAGAALTFLATFAWACMQKLTDKSDGMNCHSR
jgi:hypothetical protein